MFIVLSFFVHPVAPQIRLGLYEKDVGGKNIENVQKTPEEIQKIKDLLNQKPIAPSLKALQNLSRKQILQMKYEIGSFLTRSQHYLKHGYTLQELSTSLSYPLHQLSALINQEYKSNFNELINKYRIEYAIEIIKKGQSGHLNMNGLAKQCGFNNRNSFSTAFKKFTGLTPSEYFKVHNI